MSSPPYEELGQAANETRRMWQGCDAGTVQQASGRDADGLLILPDDARPVAASGLRHRIGKTVDLDKL